MNGNTFTNSGVISLALMVVLSVLAGGAMGAYSDTNGEFVEHWVIDSSSELEPTGMNDSVSISDGIAQVSGSSGTAGYQTNSTDVASADTLRIDVTSLNVASSGTVGVDVIDVNSGPVASVNITSTGVTTIDLSGASNTSTSYDINVVTADANSSVSYDSMALTSPNTAPSADAGSNQTIPPGSSVTFNGTGSSDLDADTLTYEWDIDDDGQYELTGATATIPEFLTGAPDGYSETVTLRVTDQHGATSTDTMTVTVEEANSAPTADAGPNQTVYTSDNVTFDGSVSSDPDGDSLTHSWDFNGDGTEDATGASPVHSFTTAGTYTVELTVSDGSLTATDTMTVTVEEPNSAPTADAGADQTVNTGDTVSFDGSASSDPDGDSLTHTWDFDGDGTVDAQGTSPVHTFYSAGTYTVELTVSDGSLTATDTMTVTVEESTYTQTFNVTNETGDGVSNASINITNESDGSTVATVTTGPDGLTSVDLTDGNYAYNISADGFDTETSSFSVSGTSQTLDITLLDSSDEVLGGDGSGDSDSSGIPLGIIFVAFSLIAVIAGIHFRVRR